jgi:hypothetical protein
MASILECGQYLLKGLPRYGNLDAILVQLTLVCFEPFDGVGQCRIG